MKFKLLYNSLIINLMDEKVIILIQIFIHCCSVIKLWSNLNSAMKSLGWEDPLEKGTATHSSILVWRVPWISWPGEVHEITKSCTRLSNFRFHFCEIEKTLYFQI